MKYTNFIRKRTAIIPLMKDSYIKLLSIIKILIFKSHEDAINNSEQTIIIDKTDFSKIDSTNY